MSHRPTPEPVVKAIVYEEFNAVPTLQTVPDPVPVPDGVVLEVRASGICRSDFSAWRGHDPVIELPHVPGHELSGVIAAIGRNVSKWRVGDRVTVPFVSGCGNCAECHSGNQQVCDRQFQPGFTHWGSFAQLVGIHHADTNLVQLPENMDFTTAASLGCRFATSFRAVVDQAMVQPGQWVAVHGCGGVGLSAIMIARALGARPIAIDIRDDSLNLARSVGAEETINATGTRDIAEAVRAFAPRGVDVSVDALGIEATCIGSIRSLKKRGRHVQIGWMLGGHSCPPVPMDLVMGNELEIVGSHGMQAHRYPAMLEMIESGALAPQNLILDTLSLAESGKALAQFGDGDQRGISVITDFG